MTPRQILDMAGYYCYGGEAAAALNQSLEFDREALVRFAQSILEAERERIKSRVKEAAESLWCIRNQLGDDPYALYIGPSLNTMQEFVNRLLEEN